MSRFQPVLKDSSPFRPSASCMCIPRSNSSSSSSASRAHTGSVRPRLRPYLSGSKLSQLSGCSCNIVSRWKLLRLNSNNLFPRPLRCPQELLAEPELLDGVQSYHHRVGISATILWVPCLHKSRTSALLRGVCVIQQSAGWRHAIPAGFVWYARAFLDASSRRSRCESYSGMQETGSLVRD